MEKSLENIEKSLGSTSKNSGKATNILGGLAQSLGDIVAALGSKKFDSKKANDILEFSKKLVQIANTVKPDGAKAFGQFAQGVSTAFTTIIDIMSPIKMMKLSMGTRMLFSGKKSILNRIVTGMSNAFKDLNTSKVEEGSKALRYLGEGLISLSKAMNSFILIGIAAPLVYIGALVVRGVIALFTKFGKHSKDIEKGGDALKSLGKGMIAFSAGLATLILVTMIAGPGIIAGIGLIALFGVTFALLGKVAPLMMRGAKALAWVGIAVAGFSAALAMLMLVMIIVKPVNILMGIATIVAFALVFALIGKAETQIAKGALILILGIAVGLFFFAGALMIMAKALEDWNLEKVLIATGLIIGLGSAIAFLGMFKSLERGVKSMFEMGVGLVAISVGILAFGSAIKLLQIIFGDNIKEAGVIAGSILVGLGLAFMILGRESVTPGAAAGIEIGFALMSISGGILLFGVSLMLLQKIFGDDLKEAGIIAGSILLGLGLAFFLIGTVGAQVMLGASAMVVAGIALISISAGILIFALSIKALQSLFPDLKEAGIIAGSILLGLGLAFAGLGVLSIPIILGSASVLIMGVALIAFSAGLFLFGATLKNLDSKGMLEKVGDKYVLKGLSILTSIGEEFKSLGWFALNPLFYGGLGVATGLGLSLFLIGTGLNTAAKALEKITDMPKLISSLFGEGGLIPVMAESFAAIGKKYGAGLLSSFLGADDVSIGIRTVRGFGDVLQELAGGIVSFSNFEEFPVKIVDPKDPSKTIFKTVNIFSDVIPQINEKLPLLLTSLSGVFANIGKLYPSKYGFLGDSIVKQGSDTVKGIGSVLSELAGGIVAFSNFEAFPVQVINPADPSKLIYKGVNIFKDVIPKINTNLPFLLTSLSTIFGDIGREYGDSFLSDGDVKKGTDAVKGIGAVLSELASGITSFANLERGLPNFGKDGKFDGTYTKVSLETIKANINKVLMALPDLFSKLKNVNVDKSSIGQLREVANIFEKFSKMGDGLNKFSVSLIAAGNSFKSFSGGFASFSAQLDKFIRFENSFSNLVTNQSKYKFNEFSKSMGTLKDNINAFNVENLKLTDSLMKSLAILSKDPSSTGDIIKESIDHAMEKLTAAIEKLANNSANHTNAVADFTSKLLPGLGAPLTPPVSTAKDNSNANSGISKTPIQPERSEDMEKISTAMEKMATTLSSTLKVSIESIGPGAKGNFN